MSTEDNNVLTSEVDAALAAGADVQDIEAATRGQVTVTEVPTSNQYLDSEGFEENPYDFSEFTIPKNEDALAAADASTIALSAGVDPSRAMLEARLTGAHQVYTDINSMARQNLEDSYRAMVDIMADEQPEELTSNADLIADTMVYDDQRLDPSFDILAESRAVVQSYEGSEEAAEEELDEAALQHFNTRLIASIMDDMAITDWPGDITGLLAWPDFNYNVADIAQRMGDTGGFTGGMINSEEFVINYRNGLRALSPADRARSLYWLSKELEDLESNKLKRVIMMMDFSGQTGDDQVRLDLGLEKAELASLGFGLGARIFSTLKRANALRRVAKASDDATTAAIVDTAMTSEEGAKALGVSKLDAAATLDPSADAIDDIIKGAPTEISTAIRDEIKIIDEMAAEATNFIEEGLGLTQAEKLKAVRKRVAILDKQPGVTNVVGDLTDQGMLLKFDVDGTERSVNMSYTQDDVTSGFKQDGVNFLGTMLGKVASPNMLAGEDRNRLVQSFERVLFQQGKVKKNFSNALERATKGMSKTERKNVSAILERGDDQDRVYTYKELVEDGIGGSRLTPAEFESYAKIRKVMDNAYAVKNKELRTTLTARGIKEFKQGDRVVLVKPYETSDAARMAYHNSDNKMVYIASPLKKDLKLHQKMDGDTISRYLDNGYVMVRSSDGNNMISAGGTNVHWTLIRREELSDLPANPLKYRPGYIPRVYKDAHFFVKQKRRMNIENEDRVAGLRTLRYFDNQTDANKYVDELENAAREVGEKFDRDDYRVLSDREQLKVDLEEDSINMFGGLYNGARGDEALKYGLHGEAATRVDPLEAVQNYINHIGNKMPMAEYRLGIEARWLNQAKETGMIGPDFNGSFADAIKIVKDGTGGNPEYRNKLIASHRQISYMTKVPTLGEQTFEGTIRSVGRALEGVKAFGVEGKNFAKYVYNMNHTNPVDAVRAATFHAMLGVGNLSQILVQGMGATIAMSVSPKAGAAAIPRMIGFSYLDNIKVPSARDAAIARMAKMDGMSNIAEDYQLWRKTGMFESVVNSSADVGSFFAGGKTDAGTLRRLLEAGTIPFKMGELANMRISFSTALNRWRGLNPGKAVTDEDLKKIVARAEQFRLNMSQANKAEFQKGLAAIPFQFQQINTKFIEFMLNKEITGKEKGMMLMGQTALFGAAGIPAGNWLMDVGYETFIGNPEDLTEGQIVAAQRGMFGYFVNQTLDIDAVATGRVAIPAGVLDSWVDLATGESDVSKLLLGPTYTVADRAMMVYQNFVQSAEVIEPEDLDLETVSLVSQVLAKSLAEVPSSTRNMLAATDMLDGGLYRDRNGTPRSISDHNLQTIAAKFMGFSSQDVADEYALKEDNHKHEEAIQEEAKRIVRFYAELLDVAKGDQQTAKVYKLAIQNIWSKYPDPRDASRVRGYVKKYLRLRDIDSRGKSVMEGLEKVGSEFAESPLNPLIGRESDNARQ